MLVAAEILSYSAPCRNVRIRRRASRCYQENVVFFPPFEPPTPLLILREYARIVPLKQDKLLSNEIREEYLRIVLSDQEKETSSAPFRWVCQKSFGYKKEGLTFYF